MNTLRAIVRRFDKDSGCLEAQLLELDLAVCAPSEDALIREIEYALMMEYQIAHDLDTTPFVSIINKTPSGMEALWESGVEPSTRELNLPHPVLEALAIALRSTGKPLFSMQEYALAA